MSTTFAAARLSSSAFRRRPIRGVEHFGGQEFVGLPSTVEQASPIRRSSDPSPRPATRFRTAGQASSGTRRTLTHLYNARPTWLALTHRHLDAAVTAAYHLPPTLPDDELLARLLELNLERAGD